MELQQQAVQSFPPVMVEGRLYWRHRVRFAPTPPVEAVVLTQIQVGAEGSPHLAPLVEAEPSPRGTYSKLWKF